LQELLEMFECGIDLFEVRYMFTCMHIYKSVEFLIINIDNLYGKI